MTSMKLKVADTVPHEYKFAISRVQMFNYD